uniref:type I protein arginine methyltransferase n=1 Tax=Alexandrium monilatum TaxID=311494 RepID=A0A7S4R913_9DINO
MDDDDGTDPGLAGLSPEFQAMVGGLAGHTASFAKMLERRTKVGKEVGQQKDDEVFFESYADLAIHEEMLKDTPRVEAYRRAIERHGPEWAQRGDVTVVDVGSGTGLLAVLAARAGAQRVIAVEASRLAYFLRQIAEANSRAGAIEVHECRAEELQLPGGERADVIVSEWMGYCLFYENMLPSVLAVRDRYLKPGGAMLPSHCRLQMAPLEDPAWRESKVGFWRDVHGIDMSALAPLATATACEKPQHRVVAPGGLLAPPFEVLALDLSTVTEAELGRFEASLSFEVPAGRRLDGFVAWFECDFGSAGQLLSTGPSEAPTHWRQTVFSLRQTLEGGGGRTVEGLVTVERHEEFTRGYRVTFELTTPGRKRRMESFELR